MSDDGTVSACEEEEGFAADLLCPAFAEVFASGGMLLCLDQLVHFRTGGRSDVHPPTVTTEGASGRTIYGAGEPV
ncbi:hypothetical protein EV644_102206 [Kribbella orskensis]|uniref:Uncharacterized protein n=1 Tax=Kribbella orskensis TaxID=2512216 RepID=A0ABY2BRF7_9ACTN|nr:hypothetical protein EV642_102531 [Kribbella sp. VKM Ac-2500]TCO29488.1 hypothetical protein EV644_102206 [Kribbella orskensis]